jgi:hypothetical protein
MWTSFSTNYIELVGIPIVYYEGVIEVNRGEIDINLQAEDDAPEYDVQMNDEPDTLEKFMGIMKPEFMPDEPPEAPNAYAQKLRKQGYGSFYTSQTNINDLVNLYATTEPKELYGFPGIESPRETGDIVFIETIRHFSGIINEQIIEDKTVQFRYKGVL